MSAALLVGAPLALAGLAVYGRAIAATWRASVTVVRDALDRAD